MTDSDCSYEFSNEKFHFIISYGKFYDYKCFHSKVTQITILKTAKTHAIEKPAKTAVSTLRRQPLTSCRSILVLFSFLFSVFCFLTEKKNSKNTSIALFCIHHEGELADWRQIDDNRDEAECKWYIRGVICKNL